MTSPATPTTRGWVWDTANNRGGLYVNGTERLRVTTSGASVTGTMSSSGALTVDAGGLTVTAGGLTVTAGGLTVTAGGLAITAGGLRLGTGANRLGLGAAEAVTIASGVATVTKPYVKLSGESASDDQLDSITWSGVAEGDLLILTRAANTITVDDGSIDLGAATRVLSATGHYLGLIYDGSGWGELFFVQGDNS